MRQQEEQLKVALEAKAHDKYKVFLATTQKQRMARRLEDLEAGKYKSVVEDPALLDAELQKAQEKQKKVVSLLEQLKSSSPALQGELDRILCHLQSEVA